MPFTASHIAPIVPLYARLGRFRVASALIIGSMAPDFHYFIPIDVGRLATHSMGGIVAFCLPMGLAAYVLYHLLAKEALLALLPEWIAVRVDRVAGRPHALPSVRWRDVLGALAIGALTHIVWDAFTHRSGWGVVLLPVLLDYVVTVRGYDLYVYGLLQHVSTLVGLALVLGWSWRWLRRATPLLAEPRPRLSARAKRLIWIAIAAAACINGVTALSPYLVSVRAFDLGTLPAFTLVTSTIAGALCAFSAFSIAWTLRRAPRPKGVVWLGR
jgi:Domain of unknown function (DUF4184)